MAECWNGLAVKRQTIPLLLVTVALAGLTAACGYSSSTTTTTPPTAPTPPPSLDPLTVRLAATGAEPRQLVVAVGAQVTFVNNDSRPHDIAGGPDPTTPDCREIDAVGFLMPGQSRQTAPLPVARTCDYHDHNDHGALFTGQLVIR